MLSLDLYLHGAGHVAPAAAPDEPVTLLLCREPDYTGYIPPMQLRRMSKAVRIGIGASRICLESAGIDKPDALSIGTAMGCLQDTETFLSKMVTQEERMLTPTAFIQSTHNTVGGQIALLLGCHGHNMTFAHRGHSFAHALINTKLYLQEHPEATVLAGGIDELTPTSHKLMQRAGMYCVEAVAPEALLSGSRQGSIAGEGAAFFAVSNRAGGAVLQIRSLHLFIAGNTDEALSEVARWLEQAGGPADLVVPGRSGDERSAPFYTALQEGAYAGIPVASFKQQCGEYATAGAYALSVLVQGIKSGSFPEGFLSGPVPQPFRRIHLINHYKDHYSCWELEVV